MTPGTWIGGISTYQAAVTFPCSQKGEGCSLLFAGSTYPPRVLRDPVCVEAISGRLGRGGRVEAEKPESRRLVGFEIEGDPAEVLRVRHTDCLMLECMEILAITTQKGIQLHAVKGQWQLDGSMQSTIISIAFAMAAEIERDLISHRAREALRAKKAAGVKLGRPHGPDKSKLDPYQLEIEALLANGSTQRFITNGYGTTEANLHHWRTKRGLKPVKGTSSPL